MSKDKNVDEAKLKSLKDNTKNDDLKQSIEKKLEYVNKPKTVSK